MKITHRKATLDDIKILNDIQDKYFDHTARENFDFLLKNENYLVIVTTIDNKIIAYACFSISYEQSDLLSICVEKQYRRQNIAQNLLEVCFDYLNMLEVKEILLEVNENNIAAQKLYLKLAFEQIHIRKNYYGDQTAVIMRKTL